MAIVPAYPFNLLNGTIADATQVMADFDSVKNAVNSGAAANGANSDITALTGLTTPLSIVQGGSGTATPGSGVAGTVGGYRNLLRRNGGFEVWQRGAGGSASFAVAASGGSPYTSDGWYFTNGATQASVVSQATGLVSGSQWCAKIIRNSGQTGTSSMRFGFPLDTDELYPMLGQFVQLSFVAKAGANFSPASGVFGYRFAVGTGAPAKEASFTGSTTLITGFVNLTTTATRYQATSSVIVPITSRQADMFFVWTPVGTAGADDSFYVDDVQLEIVPAATGYVSSDFERLNFGEQVLLCQRHYFKTFPYVSAPAVGWTSLGTSELQWMSVGIPGQSTLYAMSYPVFMRANPTVTLFNAVSGGQIRNMGLGTDCTGSSSVNSTLRQVVLSATPPASTATYNTMAVHLTADAGI